MIGAREQGALLHGQPEKPQQQRRPELLRLGAQAFHLLGREGARGVGIAGEQQQGVEELHHLLVERHRVAARVLLPLHDGQRVGHLSRGEGVPEGQHHVERGQAQDRRHRVLVHVAAAERVDAVEQRQRVSQAALAGPGQHLAGGGRDGETLRARHVQESRRHEVRWDGAEVHLQAA